MDSCVKGFIRSKVSETNSISVVRVMRSDCAELLPPKFPYLRLARRWRQAMAVSGWSPEIAESVHCVWLWYAGGGVGAARFYTA